MRNGENWINDMEEMIWMNGCEIWIITMVYLMLISYFERMIQMDEWMNVLRS